MLLSLILGSGSNIARRPEELSETQVVGRAHMNSLYQTNFPGRSLDNLLANGTVRALTSWRLLHEFYRKVNYRPEQQQPSYQTYLQRARFTDNVYEDDLEDADSYDTAGALEFLQRLRALDASPRATFRGDAWLGDRHINARLQGYDKSKSNFLRSNAHFTAVLAPYWSSTRSTHNAGDQIEAAYWHSSMRARNWFFNLVVSKES